MRTRIPTRSLAGRNYVLAAKVSKVSDQKSSLWVNPNKTNAKRKTLKDLWAN